MTVRYDLEIERWQRRGDQFAAAIYDWQNGQDLPAAAALGLAGRQPQMGTRKVHESRPRRDVSAAGD